MEGDLLSDVVTTMGAFTFFVDFSLTIEVEDVLADEDVGDELDDDVFVFVNDELPFVLLVVLPIDEFNFRSS